MTKPISPNNYPRAKEAEKLRQMALDYIIDHPGCWGPEVAEHYGWNKNSSASRLMDMLREGEVRREPGYYKPSAKSWRYWALVTKTTPAEHIRQRTLDERARYEARMIKAKQTHPQPWLYRNTDPDRMPIRNQGGQGNLPRTGWGRANEPTWV